jgi:hypothetical protein
MTAYRVTETLLATDGSEVGVNYVLRGSALDAVHRVTSALAHTQGPRDQPFAPTVLRITVELVADDGATLCTTRCTGDTHDHDSAPCAECDLPEYAHLRGDGWHKFSEVTS